MPRRLEVGEVDCVACGDTFEVGGRGRPPRTQKFCSIECQRQGRYRHGRICSDLGEHARSLALLWDGEGTFMLIGREDSGSIGFRAQFGNTNKRLVEWVREMTGLGALMPYQHPNPVNALKWQWSINGDAAESFSRQLIPYLIGKKEQAELGVAFVERLRTPALKADREWQIEWLLRMRYLNRKGPKGDKAFDGSALADDDRVIRTRDKEEEA